MNRNSKKKSSKKTTNQDDCRECDPAFIQRNIESTAAIGGVYDYICLWIEHDHADILREWRVDHPSKSAVELLTERQSVTTRTN